MDEELSPIEAAIQKRRKLKEKEEDRASLTHDLSSVMGSSISRNNSLSTNKIVDALHSLKDHWSDLSAAERNELSKAIASIPRSDVNINLSGIEHIKVQTAEIEGLDDVFIEFAEALRKIETPKLNSEPLVKAIKDAISSVDIGVTVEAPPAPNVNIPKLDFSPLIKKLDELLSKKVEIPKIIEEKYEYKDGELDCVTEIYSDGTSKKASGLSGYKVKYEYR